MLSAKISLTHPFLSFVPNPHSRWTLFTLWVIYHNVLWCTGEEDSSGVRSRFEPWLCCQCPGKCFGGSGLTPLSRRASAGSSGEGEQILCLSSQLGLTTTPSVGGFSGLNCDGRASPMEGAACHSVFMDARIQAFCCYFYFLFGFQLSLSVSIITSGWKKRKQVTLRCAHEMPKSC